MKGWKLVEEGDDWINGGIYVCNRHGERDESCVYSMFIAIHDSESKGIRRMWINNTFKEGQELTIVLPKKVDSDCILIGTFQDAAIAIDGLIRRMFEDNMPALFKKDECE